MMESGSAISVIPFYDDSLQAIHQDGQVWVSVKRICEVLGIADQAQAAKLKTKEWATTTMIVAVAEDGRNRGLFCLDLDSLPMWLATIEASRVKPETVPKLVRYQKECWTVLRNHFYGAPEPRNALQMLPAHDLTPVVEQLVSTTTQLVTMVGSLMARMDVLVRQNTHITPAEHRYLAAEVQNISRLEVAGGKWPARANGKKYDAMRAARADVYRAMRDVTSWGGKGKPWCNLPTGCLEDAKAALAGRRADAQKALSTKNSERQLTLVGLSDAIEKRGNDGKR